MSEGQDIFDVGAPQEGAPSLAELNRQVELAAELQEAIETQEADLARMKSELHKLRTSRIPDLMTELQIDHIVHNGNDVTIGEIVSGSLPKDPVKRVEAIKWLEENEGAGLIKTTIEIVLGRNEHNRANDLFERLKAEEWPVTMESNVHAQTLLAFARERLAEGANIDLEKLGIFSGKIAKIKPVKEKKGARQ